MSDSKKLKIAFIACGNITREHIDALKEIPEAEIVAGCDIAPAALANFQARTGLPETACYTDWNKMIAEVAPDAVDICLPNHLHCRAALDAFAAGCHVYVEKPMAMNAKECELMIAAAKKAGKKLAVGFQQEYCPNTKVLVKAREEGFFGDFRYMRGLLLRRRGIPGYGVFYSRECGGGPLMDIAVHLLDIMTYVVDRPELARVSATFCDIKGKEPCDVYSGAWGGWNHADYNVEDIAAVQINFKTGLVLQMATSYVNHMKEDVVYQFDVTGTKGGARWAAGQIPELFCDRFGAMMNVVPNLLAPLGRPDMFRNKLNNFVEGCRKDTPLLLSGEQGLYVQTILDAIFESAATGREIVF